MRTASSALAVLLIALFGSACEPGPDGAAGTGPIDDAAATGDDLPLGEVEDEGKADGYGAALTCKTWPNLPVLASPRIVISLDGLTLRLIDDATGFEKVFPVGVGAQDTDPTSLTYGESLTYDPILRRGTQDFEIRAQDVQPCKIWWTDAATGQRSPVFAGLPFLSWSGNYGIHGPIDNYTAPNGGSLRRGYVSHGCVRMAGADVLELAARIRGLARVPVRVQREAERRTDGRRVDVASGRWFGAECVTDADCDYTGGVCRTNAYGTRRFCTQACTRTCPDKAGQPASFCVADPSDATKGICLPQEQPMSRTCSAFDHFVPKSQPRFSDPSRRATVCMPGSPGWIGDHCLATADCRQGLSCAGLGGTGPGTCSQSCARACPDEPGSPWTFCGNEPDLGGATCLRRCTTSSNASECPGDQVCASVARVGNAGTRNGCIPR